ncbi:MAG: carbohydrate binding family 9 domain-containing protein [Ignavibacteria bacterium]|nr:carbohydrate binding family 9 domain-containing protein [Ignavibacteria bacterium]
MPRVSCLVLAVVPLLVVSVSLARPSDRVIRAARLTGPLIFDGIPSESSWLRAEESTDFTQFDPEEGAPPTEPTAVRILYDDHALYVGVICFDSNPDGIVYQLTRRDRTSEADRFTVMIDSYDDNQTAFVFSTNVAGVQSDGILSNAGQIYDVTWDAIWTVRTRRHRSGWSAEFRIPFNALRFAQVEIGDYHWGVNFRRYISRKRETVEWVMVPRSEGEAHIPFWGYVAGIRDITPPLQLAVLPFVSGRQTFESATPSRGRTSTQDFFGGLDMKFGVSRNFTADATLNSDFGQVEVDQAVLNLTVFETLFPEKRPFFVEGSHFFSFGLAADNTYLPLFFSRRIGRLPSGSFSVTPDSAGRIDQNPQTTTILGAAKVSGRSAGGLSAGLLTAVTDQEEAVLVDRFGNQSTVMTEPRGIYNVVRLRQEFEGNSWIGGILTTTGKEHTLPAVSAGIDWNARFDDGAYGVDGYGAFVRSSGTEGKRDGFSGRLLLSSLSAEHLVAVSGYEFFSRNFDVNDIGFFAQPRDHGGYTRVTYRENFAGGLFRRYSFSIAPEYRWNWDRIQTRLDVAASANAEFMNFWSAGITYLLNVPSYADKEQGIIGLYRRPASHAFLLSLESNTQKAVSASLNAGLEIDEKAKRDLYLSLGITLRPISWLELEPMFFYQRTRDEETGVLSGGRIISVQSGNRELSLFGKRDVDEFDSAIRGTLTFTRSLSLQFYAQVLLARGQYHDYALLAGSTSLIPTTPPAPRYSFNIATLNANVLLRWEYLPGSTVYLVWTQYRFEDSMKFGTGFSQRFRDTFALPHEDVLLLKVTYWFSL